MRDTPDSPRIVGVMTGARELSEGHGAALRPLEKPVNERLPPEGRLRKRADYLKCYRTGRRRNGGLVILYVAANTLGHARLGITVTRKVGNAVVRHQLKRWTREIYRRWPEHRQLPALDVVVHLKPEARLAAHREVELDLRKLLKGLMLRRERGE